MWNRISREDFRVENVVYSRYLGPGGSNMQPRAYRHKVGLNGHGGWIGRVGRVDVLDNVSSVGTFGDVGDATVQSDSIFKIEVVHVVS